MRYRYALLIAGGALVTFACSSGASSPPAPSEEVAPPDVAPGGGRQVDPAINQGDTSSPGTPPAASCEALGTLEANGVDVTLDGLASVFGGPIANRPISTHLNVLAVGDASSLQGFAVDLGKGPNANLATCTHCFVIVIGCDGADCTNAKRFFPSSGKALFNQIPAGLGQAFVGEVDDVSFIEVTIDEASATSTPVKDGSCLYLQRFAFTGDTGTVVESAGGSSVQKYRGGTTGVQCPTCAPIQTITLDAGVRDAGYKCALTGVTCNQSVPCCVKNDVCTGGYCLKGL